MNPAKAQRENVNVSDNTSRQTGHACLAPLLADKSVQPAQGFWHEFHRGDLLIRRNDSENGRATLRRLEKGGTPSRHSGQDAAVCTCCWRSQFPSLDIVCNMAVFACLSHVKQYRQRIWPKGMFLFKDYQGFSGRESFHLSQI